MPLLYSFWLWLPNLLTQLLFLRIEAFWGGELCCLQIGLFSGYYFRVNLEFLKNVFERKLTPP